MDLIEHFYTDLITLSPDWALILLQVFAGVMAIVPGYLLAWLLLHVVNRIAFGWGMTFLPDLRFGLQGIALGMTAALIAGLLAGAGRTGRGIRQELQRE